MQAELDLDALEGNLRHVERLAGPGQHLIASVKANAYGTDVVTAGRALARLGVYALATGSFAEARSLRRAGIDLPVLMFGATPPGGAAAIAGEGLIPTLTGFEAAEAVSRAASRPTAVYVKIDAGLGRLGVPMDAARAFLDRVAALPNLRIEGIYTHLPFGDAAGREWAAGRLAAFDALAGELHRAGHVFALTQARASSCLLAGLADSCNAVCVGHALYGLSPYTAEGLADLSALRPVLRRLRSRLIHVGDHARGADLAIGGLYGIERAKRVGVLPVGLAHGLAGPAAGRSAWVLVHGRRARILAVSLEHTTIDLTGVGEAVPGETVTLLGPDGGDEISLDEMAGGQGVRPLEAALRVSKRAAVTGGSPETGGRAALPTRGAERPLTRLTPALVAAYEREGHVFLPRLLPQDRAEAAMAAATALFDLDRPEVIRERDGTTVRSLMNVHRFCPAIEALVRHPSIVGPVEQLLAGPVYLFQCILNLKRPFTGDVWQWHQDLPTYRYDDGVPGDRMVNVLLFLEAVSALNGPLMIIPGSHRGAARRREVDATTTSYPIRALDHETVGKLARLHGIAAPQGPPGSVIFAHTNCVHGSGPNMSPWGRAMISLTLNSLQNRHRGSRRPDWVVMDDYRPVTAVSA